MSEPETLSLTRLFFDIDDTLYSTTEFARTARWNSVQALVDIGVDAEPESLFQELQEVIREFSSNYPYHYNKLLLRLPDNALKDVNKNIAIASAVIAYHRTKHEQLEPFLNVKSFLQALNESRIPEKPGIITEGLSVKQAEKLLRLGVYPYFDPHEIYISEQVGISKPNPKLFKTALEESDTPPGEAIFVGDRPEKDIKPANQVGMVTVLFDRDTGDQPEQDEPSRQKDEKEDLRPDYYIHDYKELASILSRQFNLSISLEG